MVHLLQLVSSLAAVTLVTLQTCAAYNPIPHHKRSSHYHLHAHVERRQSESPRVSLVQLQQLQGYQDAYRGWVTSYLSQRTQGDPATEQLRQEFTAFDGWIKSWLQVALGSCMPVTA